MVRTRIEIDGRDFVLGPGQDVNEVLSQIKAAAVSPPEFVSFSGDNHTASVLIQPTTRVVVVMEEDVVGATELDPPGRAANDWEFF